MNQNGKRRVVVIVRERGGRTHPQVFKTESAAQEWISRTVKKDSTIVADEASSWNGLHGRFTVERINHEEAYSLDGIIKRMEMLSRRVLFDHWRGAATGEKRAECVAVVGRIAQHGFRWRQRFDQVGRRFDVVAIAAGQFERDDAAVSINNRVDFRGSPAPASPNGLLLGPPFPPAAQR